MSSCKLPDESDITYVAEDPANATAYVCCTEASSLYRVDMGNGQITGTIRLDGSGGQILVDDAKCDRPQILERCDNNTADPIRYIKPQ